jgi:hypothetical protein
MKKLILTMAAIVGVAGYTYGQGQIVFGATASAATQVSTNNGTVGKIGGAAGEWEFALFRSSNTNKVDVNGTTSTSGKPLVTPWTDPGWTFTGVLATNSGTAGRFAVTDPNVGYVTISGAAVGSFQNYVIYGWNTAVGGGTLNSLINAYNNNAPGLFGGASAIAVALQMGDNGATIFNNNVIGGLSYQTPGWQLAPVIVPEPATFALAGLGAAAMLIFRRRN